MYWHNDLGTDKWPNGWNQEPWLSAGFFSHPLWILLLVGPLEVDQRSQLSLCWEDQLGLMPSLYSCFDGTPLSTDQKAVFFGSGYSPHRIFDPGLLVGEWSYCLCDHQVINTFISLCTQNSPMGHLSTSWQFFWWFDVFYQLRVNRQTKQGNMVW